MSYAQARQRAAGITFRSSQARYTPRLRANVEYYWRLKPGKLRSVSYINV
jgi:hypothetical protein